jgi:hypothetical protein
MWPSSGQILRYRQKPQRKALFSRIKSKAQEEKVFYSLSCLLSPAWNKVWVPETQEPFCDQEEKLRGLNRDVGFEATLKLDFSVYEKNKLYLSHCGLDRLLQLNIILVDENILLLLNSQSLQEVITFHFVDMV